MVDTASDMVECSALMKCLREWVNRFWSRPEMGGWVCTNCIRMDDRWETTVDRIREVDPSHRIVRSFEVSGGWHRSSARNTVREEKKKAVDDNAWKNGLPVLTIGDRSYSQSLAMLRYAGKKAGLYPTDDLMALVVDEVT